MDSGQRERVDSLNARSYSWRYRQLDTALLAAEEARMLAEGYRDGEAEALNNLGFCAFMQMDFEQAAALHRQVYDCTHNELERLVADIGLMKICQRTAQNKEFYDYRHAAIRRMRRIAEDKGLYTDAHHRQRLAYAQSEFSIVSTIYYYYLQQQPEAIACLDQMEENGQLVADTAQWLYYHYIRGATQGVPRQNEETTAPHLEELTLTLRRAMEYRYIYFEANSLQSLANSLLSDSHPHRWAQWGEQHPRQLMSMEMEADSLLPLRLAQRALRLFQEYGDLYQIASTYVTLARFHNLQGDYPAALDTLQQALECVNTHHRMAYQCRDSLDWLQPFGYPASLSVEKSWMQQKVQTVPEWISRIREQLSVAYAGLGMKEASDYNRNIYLDILDETRQDKELENRYDALEREVKQLNLLLAAVGIGLVTVVACFVWLEKLSRVRHRRHLARLHLLLDICQQATAAIPTDAESEEQITKALQQQIEPLVDALFGQTGIRLEGTSLLFPRPLLRKEEKAMLKVIEPYISWAVENGRTLISLGEEQHKLEAMRYVHEQHIADHKRQNMVKKACLSIADGIRPYIDRIIHEVDQLRRHTFPPQERQTKYEYISDLTDIINEYNDILALWIKMRQGTLSMNIENFQLNELFDLLRKGEKAFEMKQISLEVTSTDAFVKADKALTLFMINTLADNARKYTPAGGKVHIYAQVEPEYVEVSVADTGCGLSAADVARIEDEKVYDPREIGMNTPDNGKEAGPSKGSGFGLMNCRGIIEKYRKTGEIFRVCTFQVDSQLGRGSRFYFRLPKGVCRTWCMVCCLIGSLMFMACRPQETISPLTADSTLLADSLSPDAAYEQLLDEASAFADSVYYCNIDRRYTDAVAFADSAIQRLNSHYRKYAPSPHRWMTLEGEGEPAEMSWWNSLFNSDFHVILDIRNELAVAFLALNRWDAYRYNNEAYTSLYKLLGEDQSLEEYCKRLENSANNKMVALLLAIFLLLALPGGYYFLYDRKRQKARWHLEQVLEINRCIVQTVASPDLFQADPSAADVLQTLAQRVADSLFAPLSELTDTESLTLTLYEEAAAQPWTATHALQPLTKEQQRLRAEGIAQCRSLGHASLADGEASVPLRVEVQGESRCIGVLSLHLPNEEKAGEQMLLLELVARYLAMVVFNAVLTLQAKYRDIELAQDETRRAEREDNQLHVQNLVLDNCLSTIKHETLYYPNKIKQLVERLRQECGHDEKEAERLNAVGELIEYYKGIFTLLSRCASRQLEEITFRRTTVPVAWLFEQALHSFRRMAKRQPLQLECRPTDTTVTGDAVLLRFLLENLMSEALAAQAGPGTLTIEAQEENGFVRITFTDPRRNYPQQTLNELFYPSMARMSTTRQGELKGTEFLICKQIVRDHDEFVGRRGCRIEATSATGGGICLSFTIPSKRAKS